IRRRPAAGLVREARRLRPVLGLSAALLCRPAPPLDGCDACGRPGVRPRLGLVRHRPQQRLGVGCGRQALFILLRRTMANTFGSRRLVVGAHYGLRDWLSQRVTALVMAVFTVAVIVQVLMPGPLDYYKWSAMFGHQW